MEQKVQSIPIDKIKPDPNQPRKYQNEDKIREMAQSYSSQGVINPVEVDENFMIITGELRWRAAKIAGLKEVPCITNTKKLKPTERLLRQCVENAHHSDMAVMDTARAWRRLLNNAGISPASREWNKHYTWLGLKLGKDKNTIRDIVQILNEPEFVKKELKEKTTGYTLFRDANRAPEKFKNKLKKKIIGRNLTQAQVNVVANALQEAPELSNKIFNIVDSTEDIEFEVKTILNNKELVSPLKPEPMSSAQMILKIDKILIDFEKTLEALKKEILPELDKGGQQRIFSSLKSILKKIQEILSH